MKQMTQWIIIFSNIITSIGVLIYGVYYDFNIFILGVIFISITFGIMTYLSWKEQDKQIKEIK